MSDRAITACIPYYSCRRYVRRAVESLLRQTHRDLTVLVINDGDAVPPWDLLAGINDPRLVRFDLAANHGPYFAIAVAAGAAATPYLLIQDADDWSDPRRAATLLDLLRREGADLAVSAQAQYAETPRSGKVVETRWVQTSTSAMPPGPFILTRALGPEYAYRVPHMGLYRTEALRRIGGYYGGFRVGYDTLLTNLILMTGGVSHTPLSLYHRLMRPESLTHSPHTGTRSAEAKAAHHAIAELYRDCFQNYSNYLSGVLDSKQLGEAIRGIVSRNVTPADAAALTWETQRLRRVLRGRITQTPSLAPGEALRSAAL